MTARSRTYSPELVERVRAHLRAGANARPIREVRLEFDQDVARGDAVLDDPDVVRIHPGDWPAFCEEIR